MPAPSSILLSTDDNVVVATAAIAPGDRLVGEVSAVARIEPGHKAAVRAIEAGEAVVKYGQAIGRATSPIAPGEHVHSHNLAFDQGRLAIGAPVPPEAASEADRTR
ncbi:altronate dehydratase, partial [Sinorhizobium medicae]